MWTFVLSDIQVEAELENAKNSMLWEIDQGRLAFWHKAEKCFRDHGCKPDTVGSFFEVTSMITVYKRLSKLLWIHLFIKITKLQNCRSANSKCCY